MNLGAASRKFALTLHVTTSVGWIGSITCFFVLALAGTCSADPQLIRSAYRAMQLITWVVVVPLGIASLLTGVVSSLATNWGLFRHWWVALKLLITSLALLVLVIHTKPIDRLSAAVSRATIAGPDLRVMQWDMVVASGGAVFVLIAMTVLSIYKPPGLTPYGMRKVRRLQ